MPRPPRPARVADGAPNHVTLRGNNRRNLFSYAADRVQFARYLERALRETGCALHGAALLTNHVHLVLSPPTVAALSDCIKLVSQRYARYRNRRRGGTGKLFEHRFWSSPVTDNDHMAVLTAYVDLNPIDARVPPMHRAWSTLGHHLGAPGSSRVEARIWTPSEWYLSLGRGRWERARAYSAWLAEYQFYKDALRESAGLRGDPVATPVQRRVERPDRTRAA